MFNKDKSKFQKVVNVLWLLWITGAGIALLTNVVNSLLPKGSYNKFVFSDFAIGTLRDLWVLFIPLVVLYLINTKWKLFDNKYPFSRHVFSLESLFFLTITIVCSSVLIDYIYHNISLELMNFSWIIAGVLTSGLGFTFIKTVPVLNKSNSRALNFINYILLNIMFGACYKTILTSLSYTVGGVFNDFIREILLSFVFFIVSSIVIYVINRKTT